MIATLALLAIPVLGPGFELELAGGIAHSLEPSGGGYSYRLATPAVQGRAAIDFAPGVALGGAFLAVLGGQARNGVACCGSDSGNQAFSATATLVTLRLRSSGDTQFWAEGGAGIGHLISLQTDNSFENPPRRGKTGLALRLARAYAKWWRSGCCWGPSSRGSTGATSSRGRGGEPRGTTRRGTDSRPQRCCFSSRWVSQVGH